VLGSDGMETILAKALGQETAPSTAEEKRLLLSRLLGRVAHEIRNPLSSLDIHLQLLEEDLTAMAPQTRDRLAGRLEIMHGELHRLEAIVKQFVRLAGPSALDLAPVDIVKVVSHACDVLRPEAAAREIEIVTCLADGLPPLLADGDQLIQATLNLVINALQAVDRRGRVQVTVRPAEDVLVLEVEDSGPGISHGALQAIFDPYYTTKTEGSGLGLWIAQQIITAHGGTIQAANAPAGGAVFTACLPWGRTDRIHGQIKG
jgi:signal transduction histidine kinase